MQLLHLNYICGSRVYIRAPFLISNSHCTHEALLRLLTPLLRQLPELGLPNCS
jgi:hypothetical protein